MFAIVGFRKRKTYCISRLDVTSKVTGCIQGEEKGKDNNEHLSELFLPVSFYIGCLKQNANEI